MEAAAPRRSRRRRVLLVGLLVAGLIAGGPWLALKAFGAQILQRQIEQRIAGSVRLDAVEGGWFTPLMLRGCRLYEGRQSGAPVVAEASEIRFSEGVFELLFGSGDVLIELPEVTVPGGWQRASRGLARALEPTAATSAPADEDGRRGVEVRVTNGLLLAETKQALGTFELRIAADAAWSRLQGRTEIADREEGRLEADFEILAADPRPRLDAFRFEARELSLDLLPLPAGLLPSEVGGRARLLTGSVEEAEGGGHDLALEGSVEEVELGGLRRSGAPPLSELRVAFRGHLGDRSLSWTRLELDGSELHLAGLRPGRFSWTEEELTGEIDLDLRLAEVESWRRSGFLPPLDLELRGSGELRCRFAASGRAARRDGRVSLSASPGTSAQLVVEVEGVHHRDQEFRGVRVDAHLSEGQWTLPAAQARWFGGRITFGGRWDQERGLRGEWRAVALAGQPRLGILGPVLIAPATGAGTVSRGPGGIEIRGSLESSAVQWQGEADLAGRGLFLDEVTIDVALDIDAASRELRMSRVAAACRDTQLRCDWPAPQAPAKITARLGPAALQSLLPDESIKGGDGGLDIEGELELLRITDGVPLRGRLTVGATRLSWRGLHCEQGRGELLLLDDAVHLTGPARIEGREGALELEARWNRADGALRQLSVQARTYPFRWRGAAPAAFDLDGTLSGRVEHDAAAGRARWELDIENLRLGFARERRVHPEVALRGEARWTSSGAVELEGIRVSGGDGLELDVGKAVWPEDGTGLPHLLDLEARIEEPWARFAAQALGAPAIHVAGRLEASARWRCDPSDPWPQGRLSIAAAELGYGRDRLSEPRLRLEADAQRFVVDLAGRSGSGRLSLRGAVPYDVADAREGDGLSFVLDSFPWRWWREIGPGAGAGGERVSARGLVAGSVSLRPDEASGWRLDGSLRGSSTVLHRMRDSGPGDARRLPEWQARLAGTIDGRLRRLALQTLSLRAEGLKLSLSGSLGRDAGFELGAELDLAPALLQAMDPLVNLEDAMLLPESDLELRVGLRAGPGQTTTGSITARSGPLHLGGFAGRDLDVSLALAGDRLAVERARLQLAGGDLELTPESWWRMDGSFAATLVARRVSLGARASGAIGAVVPVWLLEDPSPGKGSLEGRFDAEARLARSAAAEPVEGRLRVKAGASRVVGGVLAERFARALLGSEDAVARRLSREGDEGLAARLARAARQGLDLAPFEVEWAIEQGRVRSRAWALRTKPALGLTLDGQWSVAGLWDLRVTPGRAGLGPGRDAPELHVTGHIRRRGADGRLDLDARLR